MPIVHIDLKKGTPEGFGKRLGDIVYRTLVDTINVPRNDNFQIIGEHDPDGLIYDPGYLDISRSSFVTGEQRSSQERWR